MRKSFNADRVIAQCKSWAEFSDAVVKLSKKQKGDVFERLTQLYLLTKPEYETKLKNVWICSGGSSNLPIRVRRKIRNLPATTDEGIDLVAETRRGEFWAIQCKYKSDSDKALTVKELSTFTNLAFNICAGQFAQAFVCHTTNKPVRKRKLLGNVTEIGLQRWLEMTTEQWKLIHAALTKRAVRPKRHKPRPHQKKAINAAKKHFIEEGHSRGKLIMPCGTGKSLTAFWIAQALGSKTVLVVVPSLALIKQGVEDWTTEIVAQNESPLPEWLCICSDETTGSVSTDEFVSETYDAGLPVTTDPDEIQQFLKGRPKHRRIIFVTYQSSPVLAKVARKAGIKLDLAILDESHKTAGEKTGAFATLLFDKNLRIKNRVFMTATERIMRGSHDEVVSMDNPKVYGDCFYQLSFKEAIHSDPAVISNYRILTLFVTEAEIESLIKDRRFVTDRKRGIEAKESHKLAAAIALRKAYKKFRIKHAVSFHRSIKSAADFADQQEELNRITRLRPRIDSFHISSKKTAGQRTELLTDFASSKASLIANARCLTEGVNVPSIDCVLFADPKQSTIDIVQAAGRALRPYEGKECGYIMLPIVVPDGMSFDEFAETTEFRTVSRIITALSTQDERIAEEFRVIERPSKSQERIIRFDGSVPVGLKLNFREFADAVSAKLWTRVAKANWRAFEVAREYARSLGLKSQSEWTQFAKSRKRPEDIPSNPHYTYKDKGWAGFGDWLGTGRIATQNRQYRSFKEARKFVHSLKLDSVNRWREFAQLGNLPEDISSNPQKTYKDCGWVNWGDWLGTHTTAPYLRRFRKFEEAREFARSLNLESGREWKELSRSGNLPDDIPSNPNTTYKNEGWVSMGDWLGTERVAPQLRQYRSFKDAREFARSLNLRSRSEWNQFTKSGNLPNDIPAKPNRTYANEGWAGVGDWLGTGRVASHLRELRSFQEARKFARSLNLSSFSQWNEFTKSGKLPEDIPAAPQIAYRNKGWAGVGDWLGTGRVATQNRKYRSFKEARRFARSLKLKSQKEWFMFTKSRDLPEDIPATPYKAYKDKGWAGMTDWLGTGRNRQKHKK